MVPCGLLEYTDELLADDVPLPLGVLDAVELRQEPVGRLHVHERDVEVPRERVLDLFRFTLAKEPSVHEDARELVADRLVHEEGGDGGIDAAGERAEDLGVAHLFADALDAPLDDVGGRPVREQTAPLVEEPLHDVEAARRVGDLRVELHGEQPSLRVLHGGDRGGFRSADHPKPLRCSDHGVSVAHPHRLAIGEVGEQDARVAHRELRASVLPCARRADLAAERSHHELLPVADPEHRSTDLEHSRIDRRRTILVHGGRSPREHQPRRPASEQPRNRSIERHDLRVDVALPDPPRDQLSVLRPEIENENGARFLQPRTSRCPGRAGRSCPRS